MEKILESHVLRACMDYLKAKNIYHWRSNNIPAPTKGGTFRRFIGVKGLADIIAVLPPYGTILAIECKRPGAKQSEHQVEFERNIKACGGIYLLAQDVNDLISFFRNSYDLLD